jgi:response regulator RpfG family c-di-GMP phosphodiesterase
MHIDDKLIYEYSRSLDVLYVEGDRNTKVDVLPYLNDFFKSVDEACDGELALNMYKAYKEKNSKSYDIVIVDMDVEKIDGLELGWKITKINPWQDIIFTSLNSDVLKLKKAIQMGARGFLEKPISKEHLRGIMFKMSKSVYDEKFADEYYQNIEATNFELEQKNKELKEQNSILKSRCNTSFSEINDENYSLFRNELKTLLESDYDELVETQDEIDLSVSKCKNDFSHEHILSLSKHLKHYGDVISSYSFFEDIKTSFESISEIISSKPMPYEQKNIEQIYLFFECFIYTLTKFQNSLKRFSIKEVKHFEKSIVDELNVISNRWINS